MISLWSQWRVFDQTIDKNWASRYTRQGRIYFLMSRYSIGVELLGFGIIGDCRTDSNLSLFMPKTILVLPNSIMSFILGLTVNIIINIIVKTFLMTVRTVRTVFNCFQANCWFVFRNCLDISIKNPVIISKMSIKCLEVLGILQDLSNPINSLKVNTLFPGFADSSTWC